jgi:hypothetical protein
MTVDRACRVILLLALVVVAAVTVRDFARYIDHYPYLAADDALANVSYSLGTEGRYGFLTSPVQGFSNIPRQNGFFNYGPWYFYAGAGLVWMFGYSLGALRSLHLMGIIGIATIACLWFGRRGLLASGAIVALALLYSFSSNQWPMVRPDVAVSVFAVLFIVAAGTAIEKGSNLAWCFAGLAAGCAALTHLIAWTLVTDCLVTCAIVMAIERPSRTEAVTRSLAVILGVVIAAAMFYGSFDFRIRDHLATLSGYGQFLQGTNTASAGHFGIVRIHLWQAFWNLSRQAQLGLACGVGLSVALLAASLFQPPALRRQMLALLLPPVVVLALYLGSLGFYPNYHAGYAILTQVGVWWCIAGVVGVVLRRFERHTLVAAMASMTLVAVSAVQVYVWRASSEGRLKFVHDWVSISAYSDKVAELIPRGATAWGTAFFGIETPGRIQLVEAGEAISTIERARKARMVPDLEVAPSYLVWGYPNNRDNTLQILRPVHQATNVFNRIEGDLPSLRYRLIGLVSAVPYGVTRVYSRAMRAEPPRHTLPLVTAFDVNSQSWQQRVEGPIAVTFAAADPATFDIDYAPTGFVRATRSVVADVPAGRLLLRVGLGQSSVSRRPTVIGVTSTSSFREAISELGPSIDFSPYATGDDEAYLIHEHSGGLLYVSQFDDGEGSSIDGVEVYRILPGLHEEQRASRGFQAMPASSWLSATPSVHATVVGSGLMVDGDATRQGYQLQSPYVTTSPGTTVTVRTTFVSEAGHVCVGALDATGNTWLKNGGDPSRDFSFAVQGSHGFRLVFYNCNASESGTARSRFRIADVRYVVDEPGLYVDRLMSLLSARPSDALTFPPDLIVTDAELSRPITPFRRADLKLQAVMAQPTADGWVINGVADTPFAYLLQSKPQLMSGGQRLVVTGRVNAGGLTVGLLRDGTWAGQIALKMPGPFVAVVEFPKSGKYEAIIANNSDGGTRVTDAIITGFGWLSK